MIVFFGILYTINEMNLNEESVLRFLREQRHPVSCKNIASFLKLSERTIRYVIRDLRKAGFEIVSGQDGYLYIPNEDNNKNNNISIEKNDRIQYFIKEIIFSKQGVDLYDLADKVYVSYSTIEKDISKIRKKLESFDLALNRKNGLVYIEGTEKNKRKFISRVLLANHHTMLDPAISQMCDMLNISYEDISSLLEKRLQENGLYASDYGKKSILIHILINLSRVTISSFVLDQRLYSCQNHSGHEYICAKEIYDAIKEKIHLQINDFEIEQLAFIISAKTTNMNKEDDNVNIQDVVDQDISQFVLKIISQINDSYYINLEDKDFISFFTMHLTNALFRAKNNIFSTNPLASRIIIQNALVYDVAVFISQEIKKTFHYTFNPDEITFIALHVGAVIEKKEEERKVLKTALVINEYYNYYHSPERLQSLNQKMLGRLELVTIVNDVKNLDLTEYDFIIDSTGQLSELIVPKISIPPIMNEKSINAILEFADHLNEEKHKAKLYMRLKNFFDSSLFERNHYEETPEEMIKYLSNKMIQKGIAPAEFTNSVLERESATPTSFDNSIAIPHSIAVHTARNCAAVIVNENSMQWGLFSVNIIILIGIGVNQRGDFKTIYSDLLDSFSKPDNINRLIRSKDVNEFIEMLVNV